MRDNFYHARRMLSGMWGAVGGKLPHIRLMTDSWGRYSLQGENDQFLSEEVFPLIGDDYICHDSYGHFQDAMPFPSHAPMTGTSFVGEIVTPAIEEQDVWRRIGEQADAIARQHRERDIALTALQERLSAVTERLSAVTEQLSALTETANRDDRALRESRERWSELIHHLQLIPAPRSLRAVLPLARLLRQTSARFKRWTGTLGTNRHPDALSR